MRTYGIKKVALILSITLLAFIGMLLLVLSAYFSSNPSGTYVLEGFATDRCLTLKNGNVYEDTINQRNKLISSYYETHGVWYGGDGTNRESMLIKSSFLGIETKNLSDSSINTFYPRYGLAWLCKLLKKSEHNELSITPTVPKKN